MVYLSTVLPPAAGGGVPVAAAGVLAGARQGVPHQRALSAPADVHGGGHRQVPVALRGQAGGAAAPVRMSRADRTSWLRRATFHGLGVLHFMVLG